MTSFKPNQFSQISRGDGEKSFSLCRRIAILGMVSSIMAIAGCGTTCSGHRQCRSVHSNPCGSTVGVNQPSCCQSVVTTRIESEPASQPSQVFQPSQVLLGGSGLATGESLPIESPVQVAPVPSQWSTPVEAKPDRMELDDEVISDPMEI